jgi:hypothetical protein
MSKKPTPETTTEAPALPTKQEIANHLTAFSKIADDFIATLPASAKPGVTADFSFRYQRLLLLTK